MAISIYPKETPRECFFCNKALVDYKREQDYIVKMYRITSVRDGVQDYLEFNIHIPSCKKCRKQVNTGLWGCILIPLMFIVGGLIAYYSEGRGETFEYALLYFFVGGIIGLGIGSFALLFLAIILKAINEQYEKKYRGRKNTYPPVALLEKYDAAYTIEEAKLRAGKKCGTLGIGKDWDYKRNQFFAELKNLYFQGYVIENDNK